RKGGDFKVGAKDVETTLPEITGPAKIPAFIFGLALIGIGLWMGIMLFLQALEAGDKKVAGSAQPESTLISGFEHSTEVPLIMPTSVCVLSSGVNSGDHPCGIVGKSSFRCVIAGSISNPAHRSSCPAHF
ncbi:MAG: hypothetical protein ACE5H9_20405, partial [Anaerolineae bacterium]